MLVSDGGTIRCNGGAAEARSPTRCCSRPGTWPTNLDKDAKAGLRLPAGPGSVYTY